MALFSPFPVRVARMASRPVRPLTAEELQTRDYSQIENLHQAGPIARADWTVVNEGGIEELKLEVDKILTILASS